MVLHKEGKMLYEGVKTLVVENLEMLANSKVVPLFPTRGINDSMQQSQEEDIFLKAVKGIWDEHTANMTRVGQILKYMVRIYHHCRHPRHPHLQIKGPGVRQI